VLLGVGAAALWRVVGARTDAGDRTATAVGPVSMTPGRLLVGVGLLAIVAWALPHQPPAVAADGGFPAAEAAAARIGRYPGIVQDPIRIQSLPFFKTAEAYIYPLVRDDRIVMPAEPNDGETIAGSNLVVVCDSLFDEAIGQPCGGPAEDALATAEGYGVPEDRFQAAPRQTISIYVAPQGLVSP